MANALTPTLIDTAFRNWLKGALAVLFARQGLIDFVENESTNHHQNLLNDVCNASGIPAGTTCGICTTASLLVCPTQGYCKVKKCSLHNPKISNLKPSQPCPRGLCTALRDSIISEHRYRGPSWKNTDARKWCADVYEIAKCYMPPDGYADKASLAETDFNGVLAVIINNKRFEKTMSTQFLKICEEARKAGREIRHSANHLLSFKDLVSYIDVFIQLLSNPAYLATDAKAKEAVDKLQQLKNNTLTIHADDITSVLNDSIRETFDNTQTALMHEIHKHFTAYEIESVDAIDKKIQEFIDLKSQCIAEIKAEIEKGKDELDAKTEKGSNKKKSQFGLLDKLRLKPLRLRLAFKKALVHFYKEKEAMIPASPLVDDYAVPLTELYVQPPMLAFTKPNAFGQGNLPSEKRPISSYKSLFFGDQTVPFKNIYIEANAGYGKTSFTQKLALTWCQAQQPNTSLKCKFKQEDVDTLKCFDLLFLLHLRDFQCDICHIPDLIFKFVLQNLPDKEQFSKQFIVKSLQKKICLVIFDGLDEWVHPETCTQVPGIPHNNYPEKTTVLVTTRPWKLSTIGLQPNMIDRHVEISVLDAITFKELKSNAVKLLNENKGEESRRDLSDLDRNVSLVKLENIRIPYILLQLICIWFDGHSIGSSTCETYSNTIELTLERGLKKKTVSDLPTENTNLNIIIPECIRKNELCNRYVSLLLSWEN